MKVCDDNEKWFCREYWFGDSRDGTYQNSDGYHYFAMSGSANVIKAYEYYENDEGEEKVSEVFELVGSNWFDYFGFEDDEMLEEITEVEFNVVAQLAKK